MTTHVSTIDSMMTLDEITNKYRAAIGAAGGNR